MRARGFTIIELLVGVAIVALLAMMGAPTLREFAENNRIRSSADSLAALLQTARTDALRRNVQDNRPVQFMLTAAAPNESQRNSATGNATGPNMMVRTLDPADASLSEYQFIGGHNGAESGGATGAGVAIRAASEITGTSVTSVFFNSLGQARLNARAGESGSLNEKAVFLVYPRTGEVDCQHSAGGKALRCQEVHVSVSGDVRRCDPAAEVGDPRRC